MMASNNSIYILVDVQEEFNFIKMQDVTQRGMTWY